MVKTGRKFVGRLNRHGLRNLLRKAELPGIRKRRPIRAAVVCSETYSGALRNLDSKRIDDLLLRRQTAPLERSRSIVEIVLLKIIIFLELAYGLPPVTAGR